MTAHSEIGGGFTFSLPFVYQIRMLGLVKLATTPALSETGRRAQRDAHYLLAYGDSVAVGPRGTHIHFPTTSAKRYAAGNCWCNKVNTFGVGKVRLAFRASESIGSLVSGLASGAAVCVCD